MTKAGTDDQKPARAAASAARVLLSEFAFFLAPRVFGVFAAAAGVLLLLSLVLPQAVQWLRPGDWPLAVFEASHFLTSLVTTLMVLLSLGLSQRMRSARIAGVVVFLLTAVLAIAAGRHWVFGAVFAVAGIALWLMRGAFYRRDPLSGVKVSLEPVLLLVAALAGVAWLGFFSYRNVDYRHDLWWTFAADADASRFLRGLVVSVATLVVFAVWRLMQPQRTPPLPDRTRELDERLQAIVTSAASDRPDAALAFLPDKRFQFSGDGRAFVMYGARGRNWIAMGPPVGPAESARSLAFAMRREADAVRANLIFYAVPLDFLPVAMDLGLSAQKIGETAVIDLPDFSMEGGHRARLRQAMSRMERAGGSFEVLDADGVAREAERLAQVSAAWLGVHHGAEKAFTLGRFDIGYLRRHPLAIVRHAGDICAFANVWVSGDGAHCAIDLMRHAPDAPAGVMDYLMVEIALWAKARGMATFDLGMAPLAGLAAEREADPLSRIGALVYSHGEDIYGFEGLRQYKDKFKPRWEPVYLAGPNRVSLATALADVALLTSGGWRGLLSNR